jgi:KDO2-lipid IV(A) lauroyltransferase
MAKHGKLQTTIEYLAARCVFGILSRLPVSVSMIIGQAIGRATYIVAADLRHTGQRNLLLAFPEKSSAERRKLLLGCFRSLGRELGIFSHFQRSSQASLGELFEVSGLENLIRAKELGKGVILFTGHVGAWELTSFGASVIGHPFSFLVRRLDNPKVEQIVDRARTRFGNQTLNKLGAARPMVKILRSGQVLGLLIDLNTLDEEGIFVDFFGVPASTNFMIAKLALRTQSPIIPLFSPWLEDKKKFGLQFSEPVIPQPTGDEEKDVHRLTSTLSLIIEDVIRKYPDQWLWIHKRWKTRPPGEPGIY